MEQRSLSPLESNLPKIEKYLKIMTGKIWELEQCTTIFNNNIKQYQIFCENIAKGVKSYQDVENCHYVYHLTENYQNIIKVISSTQKEACIYINPSNSVENVTYGSAKEIILMRSLEEKEKNWERLNWKYEQILLNWNSDKIKQIQDNIISNSKAYNSSLKGNKQDEFPYLRR